MVKEINKNELNLKKGITGRIIYPENDLYKNREVILYSSKYKINSEKPETLKIYKEYNNLIYLGEADSDFHRYQLINKVKENLIDCGETEFNLPTLNITNPSKLLYIESELMKKYKINGIIEDTKKSTFYNIKCLKAIKFCYYDFTLYYLNENPITEQEAERYILEQVEI